MNKFAIQIKREFWECRASFIRTPIVMSLILMGLLLLGIVPLQNKLNNLIQDHGFEHETVPPDAFQKIPDISTAPEYLTHGLAAVYSVFSAVLLLVLTFYFTNALYSDRRDQSILFWKSLPVSESQTVAAKLATGIAGAPFIYALASFVTGAFFLMTFLVYAGLIWNMPLPSLGDVATTYFISLPALILAWLLLALWLMPMFAWLLVSSAIARKTPFMIALGIPAGLMTLEVWVFGSGQLFRTLGSHIGAGAQSFQAVLHDPANIGEQLTLALTTPGFSLGLAASAGLLFSAIWLRNNKWEI